VLFRSRKYLGICQHAFKDSSFFDALERMGLFQPTPDFISNLIVFLEPPYPIPGDLDEWRDHYGSETARRTTFRAVCWSVC